MTHISKIVSVKPVAHGIMAVRVRCCGDPSTDMVLTLHELGRPDEEIDADIQKHRDRVEKLHADHQRVHEHIKRLITQ